MNLKALRRRATVLNMQNIIQHQRTCDPLSTRSKVSCMWVNVLQDPRAHPPLHLLPEGCSASSGRNLSTCKLRNKALLLMSAVQTETIWEGGELTLLDHTTSHGYFIERRRRQLIFLLVTIL